MILSAFWSLLPPPIWNIENEHGWQVSHCVSAAAVFIRLDPPPATPPAPPDLLGRDPAVVAAAPPAGRRVDPGGGRRPPGGGPRRAVETGVVGRGSQVPGRDGESQPMKIAAAETQWETCSRARSRCSR